jgi:valyl-tRNA synthetase
VGTSERTKAVIEPRLSDQWFLEDLVKPAIKAVLEDGEVKLHPKRFDNTYAHWLNNIRDWNISRQLWWGQQILLISTEMAKRILWLLKYEAALELAKVKLLTSHSHSDLRQDVDALDTWFSSWLWPMSVLAELQIPKTKTSNTITQRMI